MSEDIVIDRARAILRQAKDAALADPATYRRPRGGYEAVISTLASLEGRLVGARSTHPDWACLPELAITLTLLWDSDPDRYTALMSGVAGKLESVGLNTADGLIALDTVLTGLQDDHDYTLDPAATAPRLCLQSSLAQFAPLIRPIHLFEALKAHSSRRRADSDG